MPEEISTLVSSGKDHELAAQIRRAELRAMFDEFLRRNFDEKKRRPNATRSCGESISGSPIPGPR